MCFRYSKHRADRQISPYLKKQVNSFGSWYSNWFTSHVLTSRQVSPIILSKSHDMKPILFSVINSSGMTVPGNICVSSKVHQIQVMKLAILSYMYHHVIIMSLPSCHVDWGDGGWLACRKIRTTCFYLDWKQEFGCIKGYWNELAIKSSYI